MNFLPLFPATSSEWIPIPRSLRNLLTNSKSLWGTLRIKEDIKLNRLAVDIEINN